MSGPVRSRNRITGEKKVASNTNLREEEVGVVVCRRVGTCLTVAMQVTAGRHTACFTITQLEKLNKDPKNRESLHNNALIMHRIAMFHNI